MRYICPHYSIFLSGVCVICCCIGIYYRQNVVLDTQPIVLSLVPFSLIVIPYNKFMITVAENCATVSWCKTVVDIIVLMCVSLMSFFTGYLGQLVMPQRS